MAVAAVGARAAGGAAGCAAVTAFAVHISSDRSPTVNTATRHAESASPSSQSTQGRLDESEPRSNRVAAKRHSYRHRAGW